MSGRRNQRILKREEEPSPLKRPRYGHQAEGFCLVAPDGTPATVKSPGESPDGGPVTVGKNVKSEDSSVSAPHPKRRKTDPVHRGWAWLLNPDGSPATVGTKKKSEEKPALKKETAQNTTDPVQHGWAWLLNPDGSPATVETKKKSGGRKPALKKETAQTKTEPVGRGWYWLLAPDGTPATVGTRKRGNLTETEDSYDDTVDKEEIDGVRGSNCISKQQRDQWEEKFRLLVEYKDKHKTTNVPRSHPTLGRWVQRQRTFFKSKRLIKYRRRRLESIGFVFDVYMSQWMEMYDRLVSYKEKHGGSTNIPRREIGSNNCSKLGIWVITQRRCYASKKLSEEKIALLESLGFAWRLKEGNTDRNVWMEMYQRLLAYKQKYNNTRVHYNFKSDPKLGKWVASQRMYCKEENRIDLLNYIGFEWNPMEDDWMEMYRRLLAYKKQYKNTRVPCSFKSDPKLGAWVRSQRRLCKDKNRVRQLSDIGFEWEIDK